MESRYYENIKTLIFKIAEEIDEHTSQKIRGKADYEIKRYMPKKIIFDFDSVTFMDSAGIGLIIGRYKLANIIGAKVELQNLNNSIRKIFDMSGILKLIPETKKEDILPKIGA